LSCQFIRAANVPPCSSAFLWRFAANATNKAEPHIPRGRYHEAGAATKVFPDSHIASAEVSMVITAAHIQPIVALIAGILILLMPRFLNFVIAIYLIFIGLSGLGVLKMLHF
jgi:hypothetical protein